VQEFLEISRIICTAWRHLHDHQATGANQVRIATEMAMKGNSVKGELVVYNIRKSE